MLKVPARPARLALALGLLLGGCSSAYFEPSYELTTTPQDAELAYRDIAIETPDGLTLDGWFLPAEGGAEDAHGTVVFAHANRGNMGDHVPAVWWLPAQGFNVVAFDYRGVGKSDGAVDLAGAHRDLRAAVARARRLAATDPRRLAVYGQQIGASIAVVALAERPRARRGVQAVVAESPIADYQRYVRQSLAQSWLTWPVQYPGAWLAWTGKDPESAVARLAPVPLAVIANGRDRVVPPSHAEALYQAARPPRALWRSKLTGHLEFSRMPGNRRHLVRFLKAKLAARDGD